MIAHHGVDCGVPHLHAMRNLIFSRVSSANTFFDHNVSSSSSVIGNACFFAPPILSLDLTFITLSSVFYLRKSIVVQKFIIPSNSIQIQLKANDKTVNNFGRLFGSIYLCSFTYKSRYRIIELIFCHVINIYKNWTDIRRMFGRFIPRPLPLLKCIYSPSYLAHRCR